MKYIKIPVDDSVYSVEFFYEGNSQSIQDTKSDGLVTIRKLVLYEHSAEKQTRKVNVGYTERVLVDPKIETEMDKILDRF